MGMQTSRTLGAENRREKNETSPPREPYRGFLVSDTKLSPLLPPPHDQRE